MKKIFKHITLLLIALLLLTACRKTFWCDGGRKTGKTISPGAFHTIVCGNYTRTQIIPSDDYRIQYTVGEKLASQVNISLKDSVLTVKLDAHCLLRNPENALQVKIFAPDLKVIRNASIYEVFSTDTLKYRHLKLISENFNDPGALNAGTFRLLVHNEKLDIVANGISVFNLKGKTKNLFIGFYGNHPRFEGENLTVQHLVIHHNSTNDILANPVQSAEGDMYSTGDLILYHRPPVLQINRHYKGRIIFR